MKVIESIIYKDNYNSLTINDKEIIYNDISMKINEEMYLNYLKDLFLIINDWNNEYINLSIIDGGSWNLVIKFVDNSERKYVGRSDRPNNFEEFENLNFSLIKEVQNGYIEY